MKRSFILFIVLATILASGCVKDAPKLDLSNPNVQDLLAIQLKEKLYKKQWIEYNCANSGHYNIDISGNKFIPFECGSVKKDPDEAVRIRNEVLDNGIGIIDSAYNVYIRNIRKKRSVGEFLADLAETGASTAIGITNGERAIQVIGVALTGFRAGRKSAALNFFDEKTTSVLIKRMDTSRSQIIFAIKQLQRKPTAEYSFDSALKDIVNYFDAGTLNRAFTELDKQASVDADIASKGVLRIQNLKDINAIPTAEQAKTVDDIYKELGKLRASLDDKNKASTATGTLKSIYTQIVEGKKFDEILNSLKKAVVSGTSGDFDSATMKILQTAFAKLAKTPPEELTGIEYYQVVSAVLSQTNTETDTGEIIDKPELRDLLLEYTQKALPK
jgi:hypothetical protein